MTLVEVLIVVALLGVLSALAVLGARPMSNRFRQRDGVEQAAQLVSEAQVRARATGRCHRVVAQLAGALAPAGTPGDSLVLQARPTADCEVAPGTVVWVDLERAALSASVRPVNVDNGTWTWSEFRPNGRVRLNGGTGVGALIIQADDLQPQLVLTVNQGVTCQLDQATPGPCP
jgi:prepilin-type N-terminal cleavage/methylation domain-containing protein